MRRNPVQPGPAPPRLRAYAPGHETLTGPFWAAWPDTPVMLYWLTATACLYWVG